MMSQTDESVDLSAPVELAERSVRAWWSQALILTWRQLIVAARDVPTLVQVLVFPLLTMFMFKVVLGDIIGQATGQDSAYGTVPLVVLTSVMFGSVVAATRLNLERASGLLGRLYVLPINRGADFTARVLGESVRSLVTTFVLIAAGFAIGFRFTQGVGAAIGIFAVAVAYATAFAMLTLALAVNSSPGAPLVPYLGLLSSVMMFFNSGFSPIDSYPAWLQPVVQYQPMTPAIDLMRSLAVGGPIVQNAIMVVAWTFGIVILTTYPALRGYRRAAVG